MSLISLRKSNPKDSFRLASSNVKEIVGRMSYPHFHLTLTRCVMVDLEVIQSVYYMVAATGVLVAAVFYVLNLQTQRTNMKTNQETRQIQLLLENDQFIREMQGQMKDMMDMRRITWSSFDDYQAKYGPGVDPDGHSYRLRSWWGMHIVGRMVEDGLIGFDTYIRYMGDTPSGTWLKYGDLIKEYRVRFHWPYYLEGLEYLAKRIDDYRLSNGLGPKTIDDVDYHFEVKT
jgi:hypothetical protein